MGRDREVPILNGPAWANYWQQIGLSTSTLRETPRLAQDLEAKASFPGFSVELTPRDVSGLRQLHSSRARLPENAFQASPVNVSRYMNSQLDNLIDSYFRTIPEPERIVVLGRIIRHIAEQLPVMGIYHDARPDAFSYRLINVIPAGQEVSRARTRAGTPTSGT